MNVSRGTLRYSVKRDSSSQNWWLVLDCDPNLGDYYRHLCSIQNVGRLKLAAPYWGPHITVSRNEEPPDSHKHLWGAYEGEVVSFSYATGIRDNYSPERYRSFFWLEVECQRLHDIRKELGLPPIATAWVGNFHLTIGCWENPDRREWYLRNFKGITGAGGTDDA